MTTALPLLSNADAAARIGVTPGTLKFWRHKGRGPKFIKFTDTDRGTVAYDPADVEAWLEARKFASTSAVSAARIKQGFKVTAPAGQVPPAPWQKPTA